MTNGFGVMELPCCIFHALYGCVLTSVTTRQWVDFLEVLEAFATNEKLSTKTICKSIFPVVLSIVNLALHCQ